MAHTRQVTGSRVVSADGTSIAYWTSGQGRPLVLVHGTTADHTSWRPLLAHLEPHVEAHVLDRRGRGGSGDAPIYELAREFEDVAAVVDAVAAAVGAPVDLLGHSYGGLCAFGAATLTPNVRRLVLYEGWPLSDPGVLELPPGVAERIDALVAAGDPDAALETFLGEVLKAPTEQISAMRGQPGWPTWVANVHTVTRELSAAVAGALLDARQAAAIAVPTLLLTGEHSPDPAKADVDAVAACLPRARIEVIEGQQHLAHHTAPQRLAEAVTAFLADGFAVTRPG